MKITLTGATGFLGANLVRRLLARGDEVHCIIRRPNLATEGLGVTLHAVPLEPSEGGIDALARVVEGSDAIMHVAGLYDPGPEGASRMHVVHVDGCRALLGAATLAGVPRFVFCSSSITVGYGPLDAPGHEDSPLDPDAAYGVGTALRAYHDTKLAGEALTTDWGGGTGVIVNPDFILGPWDVKPTSGQLILTMAKKPVPFYPRGGKCFQHASDCADGHILAAERGVHGRRYLLGNENLSYRDFMTQVAEVVGRRPPGLPVPGLATWAAGLVGTLGARVDAHRFAGLDPRVLAAMQRPRHRSAARSFAELGVPRTPVRQAIEDAHRWFVDHGYCR